MLKADPFAQLKLLDVQELDSRLAALAHQQAVMPEHAELRELSASRAGLDRAARDLEVRVDDLTRDQRKAEADVEQVKGRRSRDQDRLDKGLVTNPKDLERLQHELVSLDRRISELEDIELAVMEDLDTAQRELSSLHDQLAGVDQRGAAVQKSRDEKTAAMSEESASVTAERATTASGLPADLLALYDKLRDSKGGVGAAALRQRRCGGCGLELSPADLAVIKAAPTDEVMRCEECSRILVRTSESGL